MLAWYILVWLVSNPTAFTALARSRREAAGGICYRSCLGIGTCRWSSSMIFGNSKGVIVCRGWCTTPSWMCDQNGATHESSGGRTFHAAASVQHSLYLFGGRQTRNQPSTSFLPFIHESELFQRIDEATFGLQTIRVADGCAGPSSRSHFTFIPWRGRYLITFGGQVHACCTSTIDAHATTQGTCCSVWDAATNLSPAYRFHQVNCSSRSTPPIASGFMILCTQYGPKSAHNRKGAPAVLSIPYTCTTVAQQLAMTVLVISPLLQGISFLLLISIGIVLFYDATTRLHELEQTKMKKFFEFPASWHASLEQVSLQTWCCGCGRE